jgi:hypothetical protein
MINCRRWAAQYVWKPKRDGIELDIPPDGLLVLNHADVILTAAPSDAAPLASSRTMPASWGGTALFVQLRWPPIAILP